VHDIAATAGSTSARLGHLVSINIDRCCLIGFDVCDFDCRLQRIRLWYII